MTLQHIFRRCDRLLRLANDLEALPERESDDTRRFICNKSLQKSPFTFWRSAYYFYGGFCGGLKRSGKRGSELFVLRAAFFGMEL